MNRVSKWIIDTEKGTGVPYVEQASDETPDYAGEMLKLIRTWNGAKEWDGIVSGIQKWFYGSVVKASWCATTMSYLLTAVGLNVHEENVYNLMMKCKSLSAMGIGSFYASHSVPKQLKEGDILFMLWNGTQMTTTSSKHVTMCNVSTTGSEVKCIGGNQNDGICVSTYYRKNIYAVYRLD